MDKELEEQIKQIAREEAANRYSYNTAYHTKRIADIMEEILTLVKLDQEKMAKRFPDENQE
jgi:ABC-type proline/glycine betaine transport system ATPase subunit